jgi:hypothetical protein
VGIRVILEQVVQVQADIADIRVIRASAAPAQVAIAATLVQVEPAQVAIAVILVQVEPARQDIQVILDIAGLVFLATVDIVVLVVIAGIQGIVDIQEVE